MSTDHHIYTSRERVYHGLVSVAAVYRILLSRCEFLLNIRKDKNTRLETLDGQPLDVHLAEILKVLSRVAFSRFPTQQPSVISERAL